MRTALITGITGQDGSYLTELLLSLGYTVHGIVRRSSLFNRSRIEHLRSDPTIYGQRLFLHYADLTDHTTMRRILQKVRPEELYHLAGQSHVGWSFEIPESTCQENGMATLALLEICRDMEPPPRMYHASSSEIFGSPVENPQDENTPYRPVTPYGCAKAFATDLCRVYRSSYRLFVCSGITYNHESPRRGESFVTHKIAATVARQVRGSREVLELGNLDSIRDWGFAGEFVHAMYAALQQPSSDDYVIATGTAATVREFATAAYAEAGIAVQFRGTGIEETAVDVASGRVLLRVHPRFFRAADPCCLIGNPAKAKRLLGWEPQIRAIQLAQMMTRHFLEASGNRS